MKCRYCNGPVKWVDYNQSICEECNLVFDDKELVEKPSDIFYYFELCRDPYFFDYTTTKELLNSLTIELYNYLSLVRQAERHLKNNIYHHKAAKDGSDGQLLKKAKLTRQKIENILIERQGYYPEKVFKISLEKKYAMILQRRT